MFRAIGNVVWIVLMILAFGFAWATLLALFNGGTL